MRCIIIGAGVAGLAAAARLRKLGHSVVVIEATSTWGGKLGVLERKGYRFDTGPSLFTSPELLTEVLDKNEHPTPKFEYKRIDPVCNYYFSDGRNFSAPADSEEFAQSAAQFFGESEKDIKKYLIDIKELYNLTAPVFIFQTLHKLRSYLNLQTLKGILGFNRLKVFQSLNRFNQSQFKSTELIMFFNRFATYNGSNPYSASAALRVIPHLEIHLGAYFPNLGMRSIVDALYQRATDLGVEFQFNTPVKKILTRNNRITGIQTRDGGVIAADCVVSAIDVKKTWGAIDGFEVPKKLKTAENSSSAIVFYWGVKKQLEGLSLHNIFFTEDYKQEFNCIFKTKDIYRDPTIYINITSREKPDDAPVGCDNYFVMINAPADYGQNWEQLIAETRANIIKRLSKELKCNFESIIEFEDILTPPMIAQKTGSDRGSIYGSSSNSTMSAFNRQANFSKKIKGLYFCGGSAHPGGGIPLCLAGAKIVSDLIGPANTYE